LKDSEKLDAIARSRCLTVLSVLSGETSVTQAIAQAKISRGTYYQMETRALKAMLAALNPLATTSQGPVPDLSTHRMEALMGRIRTLEQEHRRDQRLMLLMRKTIRSPRPQVAQDGWTSTSALLALMPSGKRRWPSSKTKASGPTDSIPTKDGANAS
jgi:hypothetical protein